MASRTTTDPIEILLEVGIDLDNLSGEEDYLSALMEAVAIIELLTKGKGDKRSAILRKEVIRVRKSRKERDKNFKARKTTVSASSFKKGTAAAGRKKSLSPGIEPQILLLPSGSFDEKEEKKAAKTKKATGGKQKDLLQGIAKSVSNIADIMKNQHGLKKKKGAYDRKRAEAEKRKLKESNLEKSFKGLASAAEKIIAPVKGVLEQILDFFLKIIVGRFLVKLIGWIGDPKNKKKVDSVVRFLVDHGPKLLAAFLLFGTSIGRFAVRLSTVLLKGALRLGAAAAKFAIGFARRHPAAAAITAIVGGAAIAGAMNKKDDADADDSEKKSTKNVTSLYAGGLVPSYAEGGKAGPEDADTSKIPKTDKENLLVNLFGMTPAGMALKGAKSVGKGASSFGSSVKEKGLGNAAMDLAGGAFGNLKGFMDEKGITDVLMMHPLAKIAAFGFGKGKEAFGNLKGFADEKGITDLMMSHPLAKMGAFGLDKFMNFGKDPARDITGQSGQDIKGAGADTQLISARPGDFVVNKKTATAMGPDYFDAISTSTGEKVSGAGPDSQMIAVRPGEIVVNRETVDALGADHFLSLNRLFGGGGANKPKMANVQAASGGGFVLPAFSSGGYVSGTDTGKRGTPDPEKEGAISIPTSNKPSTDVESLVEKIVDRKLTKGQGIRNRKYQRQRFRRGGRSLGSTTQGEGGNISGAVVSEAEKIKAASQARLDKLSYEGKGTILSGKGRGAKRSKGKRFDAEEKARLKEIQDRGGFLGQLNRSFTGMLDILSGGKSRYEEADKASRARVKQAGAAAIGRYYSSSDGKYYKDYNAAVKAREKRLTALKTSQATPKATTETLTKEQLLGKSGVMPTSDQLSATATKRHAELMKSTDQKRIADYDAKHGAGAYSKKLQEKLNKIYSPEKAKQMTTGKVKPTGKVVGRENLSPQAQAAIARLEAKKGLPPDMQYTRNGKRISAEEFNRIKSGNIMPGGGKPGGFLGGIMEGAKNMLGGMFKPGETKTKTINTYRDGNIGTPTAEEQKAIDRLNANRARADKREAEFKAMMNRPKKRIQDDPLFAEYERIQDDINHPLHDKVAGDLFDDTGTKDPMRFEDFKKFKAQQSQAKLSPNQPSPAAPPAPPSGGGSNVKVVRAPSSEQKSTDKQGGGGSDVDASPAGNGNKAKWNILGIPMPF